MLDSMATITLKDPSRITSVPDGFNQDAYSRPSYASFGDEGVTATANAYGHLLQITRYFGNEPSGFFCVDLPDTPPPNLVALRRDKLESSFEDCNVGMRLEFANSEGADDWIVDSQALPKMKFIDDRWPLFITQTPSFDLTIQYIISKKTIYQEYTFEPRNSSQIESIPNILLNADFLIRNLNFVESNDENDRWDPDKESFYQTHHDSRIIRKHVSLQTGNPECDTVGLVIMPFINGQPCNIEKKDRNHYKLSPGSVVSEDPQTKENMVVTLAYTLELMRPVDSPTVPHDESRAIQDPFEAAEDLKAVTGVMDLKFEKLPFAKEDHLNFILRRNLEHILSVCSIPAENLSKNGIVPIALTCGDISNHRIMAGASFYAFEYLLLALQHLKNDCTCGPKGEPCQDYKCRMRYRIRRTCYGHLIWLYEHALHNPLSSHHWASGKVIKPSDAARIAKKSNMDILKKSIMDIPFHIIKAADFLQINKDDDISDEFVDKYKDTFARWISLLHRDNKNNEYVFPRSKDTTMDEFYFAEQAIIWRALKAGETFGIESLKVSDGKRKTYYSALDIQNSVLQKFSCESSVSGKPMIAISRSVYGNLFELGIQDTAIFYAVDHGIFTTSEDSGIGERKLELWMNTLDHQMQTDGNINAYWGDLSQAVLAVMISVMSRRTRLGSVKRRHESAKSAILRSSSPNGLLTGQSSEDQEPVSPKDASEYHSYWHATFEMPYILWMYGENLSHADESLDERALNEAGTLKTASMEPTLTVESYGSSRQSHNGESYITHYTSKRKAGEYLDEWLYAKPRFLTFEVDLREKAREDFIDQYKSKDLGIVIKKAFDLIQQPSTTIVDSKESLEQLKKGYIVDVPQFTGSTKTEDVLSNYIYGATNLLLHIDPRVRLVPDDTDSENKPKDPFPVPAKKRLMHFYDLNYELALTCCQASSETENLSLFFDRHATYDKYFYEETQLIFNSWTTELHLSFYQILSGNSAASSGISQPKNIRLPSFRNDNKSQTINKVSMSVRFDGDIFDNSWNCHFIEFKPQLSKEETPVQPFTDINIMNRAETTLWQERRILELLIVDKMLDEILQSSKDVLQQIKRSIVESSKNRDEKSSIDQNDTDYDMAMLLAEFKIFDKTPADVFLSIRSAWHQFQRITDIVEEDLRENIDTINLWMNREKNRHDKPQWLESSEQKYGWTISQLLTKNNRKVDELKRCYDSIKVFNASLTKRMEVASSKWEIQSSDDIRLFTYVTVVFLPISFATSIFSMSDSPSTNTLRHMIVVAAVALGATILALFNAKALDSKMVRPIYEICRRVLKGIFSLLHHIVVLPCIYFVARYIYYPIFPPKTSEASSTETSSAIEQKSTELPTTTAAKKEEASVDAFSFAGFVGEARKKFHKFDRPMSLAQENFEKAKNERAKTKQSASAVWHIIFRIVQPRNRNSSPC